MKMMDPAAFGHSQVLLLVVLILNTHLATSALVKEVTTESGIAILKGLSHNVLQDAKYLLFLEEVLRIRSTLFFTTVPLPH